MYACIQIATRRGVVALIHGDEAEVAQLICLAQRVAKLRVQVQRLLVVVTRGGVVALIPGDEAEVAQGAMASLSPSPACVA